MGRQWLQAKREVANLKKGQVVGKLVKEIMVAAKLGGPDPEGMRASLPRWKKRAALR
jgi:transcriptional/translational regulatory protein YebC/TACO1